MSNVTLYTTTQCSRCVAIKHRLKAYGIEYTTINMENDSEALHLVKDAGYTMAPVLRHGQTWYGTPLAILEWIRSFSSDPS